MPIEKELRSLKRMIDSALRRLLPPAAQEPRLLHRAMRYSVFSGGKRIRPAITVLACRACGGKRSQALPAACAVELVHTYSLIHDDLPAMDDDDLRRGKPTCHRTFGEAMAILAGDALLTGAFEALAGYRDGAVTRRAVTTLAHAAGAAGMVGGQVMDIAKTGRMTPSGMAAVNRLKTGRLFEAAAALGGVAAGAGAKHRKALASYGRAVGEAFQLVDDCLDGDGFVRLLGGERTRAAAHAATRRADAALAVFGAKAASLRALAAHTAHRIH